MYFDKNYISINICKIKQKNLLNISNAEKQENRLKIISKRGIFQSTCNKPVDNLPQAC